MSQQLDLDFIQTPFFSLTRFSWLSLFLLVTSLIVTFFTWQTYQAKRIDYLRFEAKLAEINQQQQQRKLPIKQAKVSIQPEQLKQLQETVNALGIPWNELFEAIEQADGKDIALLSVEPNSQKQQVVVTGEAKNLQVALAYIAQLESQPALSQVFLQKHSIDEVNVSKPVSFTIFAKWKIL
jgi:predicted nuclease with TOPRIM domain